MALVDLYLNGKIYQIACDDGQETHVKQLAERFDARLRELAGKLGPAPEMTLLALAALMTEDELHTVRKLENFANKAGEYPIMDAKQAISAFEKETAVTLDLFAGQIETMADELEKF